MKKTILCLSITALLSACGGSSGGSSDHTTTYSTPEKLTGSVTDISETHITVNGFELDATQAEIEYGNSALNLTDIKKGMHVEIETNRKGAANDIELDPSLVGKITEVNSDSITVNGSIIPTTSTNTVYSNTATYQNNEYQEGNWVLIDGYVDNNAQWIVHGIYDASFIHTNEAEIEGPVSSLDTSNRTFVIGQTLITYSGNTDIDDDSSLANGLWVEVEGSFDGTQFSATEIDFEDDSQYDGAEVEGTITWVNNEQTSIELNGRTYISVTSSTHFEDGVQSDLIKGARIDAELINGTSGLEATEIEFEDGTDSNTSKSNEFALSGTATWKNDTTFSINGFEFTIDSRTQFEDNLSMASIAIDNKSIEIEGIESTGANNNTIYLVKEVEALDLNDNDIDLQGSITDNQLWGYSATDDSLTPNGAYVEMECLLVTPDTLVSNCQIDN